MHGATEQYICSKCGKTSPVYNEHCPECGAPIPTLDDQGASPEQDEDDSEEVKLNPDGSESLEDLKEKEEREENEDSEQNAH